MNRIQKLEKIRFNLRFEDLTESEKANAEGILVALDDQTLDQLLVAMDDSSFKVENLLSA